MSVLKKMSLSLLLGLSLTAMNGCSHSKPTEGDAEKVFRKALAEKVKGDCLEVTSFEKTNGISGEEHGTKIYVLEYTAVTKVKTLCNTTAKFPNKDGESLEAFRGSSDPKEKDAFPTPCPVGTEIHFKGQIEFMQTENGWRAAEDKDETF